MTHLEQTDLVPLAHVEAWRTYLAKEYPAAAIVGFSASQLGELREEHRVGARYKGTANLGVLWAEAGHSHSFTYLAGASS